MGNSELKKKLLRRAVQTGREGSLAPALLAGHQKTNRQKGYTRDNAPRKARAHRRFVIPEPRNYNVACQARNL